MRELKIYAVSLILWGSACAALTPPLPVARPVADVANLISDRGAHLEILPTQRLAVGKDASSGRIKRSLKVTTAAAAIGPGNLGVVFNHDTHQSGYITGEISFKPKGTFAAAGASVTDFPGLKHLASAGIYVVQAGTPAQFLSVLRALQSRSDLEWVEPIINYGLLVN